MSQLADAKNKVSSQSAGDALRQQLRATTTSLLKQYFASTLNTENDIVNIFMALMYRESSFNVDAQYATALSPSTSSGARDYQNSAVIQNLLNSGNARHEPEGRTAMGLTQVMGWNIIRGASKSGKCLIESARPDLAGRLCVSPGDSVAAKLKGSANIENSILAGLVVLESKYKTGYAKNGYWAVKIGNQERVFPSRISAAVSMYLGMGLKDAAGTTPTSYAQEIIGGIAYSKANGSVSPAIGKSRPQTAIAAANGPTTVGGKGSTPGCVSATS